MHKGFCVVNGAGEGKKRAQTAERGSDVQKARRVPVEKSPLMCYNLGMVIAHHQENVRF